MSNGVKIICAGGHAKTVIDILLENEILIDGVYDDYKPLGVFYRNVYVKGVICEIDHTTGSLFTAIGDTTFRKKIVEMFPNATWINCIDKLSRISPTANIGLGNYIGPMCVISSDVLIGNHNIINDNSTIGHDTLIGNYCHIAPNSVIGGGCTIQDLSLIGSGSAILPKKIISEGSIIGSGAVITKHTEKQKTYVGVPGKILRISKNNLNTVNGTSSS